MQMYYNIYMYIRRGGGGVGMWGVAWGENLSVYTTESVSTTGANSASL